MHICIVDSSRKKACDHYRAGFTEVAYAGATPAGTSLTYVLTPEVVQEVANVTLLSFLNAIQRALLSNTYTAGDVILVSHAGSDQIAIGVSSGINRPLTTGLCDALRNWVEDYESGKSPARLPDWSETELKWAKDQQLIETISFARDCNLGHVALRSCNVGNSPALLRSLMKLLACQGVSAPTVRDVYASMLVSYTRELSYLDWSKRFPGNLAHRVGTKKVLSAEKEMAFVEAYVYVTTFWATEFRLWVRDEIVLNAWLKEKYPNPPAYSAGDLVLHFLMDERGVYFPYDKGYGERIAVVGC